MSESLKSVGRREDLGDILIKILESEEGSPLSVNTLVSRKPVEVYKYIEIGESLIGIAEV